MSGTIYYKTDEEIELIRKSSLLVTETIAEVGKYIKAGVTTLELDEIAETFIRDHGAIPAFKGYADFPNTLCTSVNHHVVHGIPNKKSIKEGDVLSIDCGTIMNGFYGDSAYTYALQGTGEETMKLLKTTLESLYCGIEKAVVGNRLGDIGYAIQQLAEIKSGYGVVRDLVGHGIGRALHESPEVPNFGRRGKGLKLLNGLVIAIEPMVNLGNKRVTVSSDGWTVATIDQKPSAHYEHTLAVRKGEADILSSFKPIEEVIKNNPDLQDIN